MCSRMELFILPKNFGNGGLIEDGMMDMNYLTNNYHKWKSSLIYLQKSAAIIGVGNASILQTLIRIVIDIGIALFRDVIEHRMV